ncbi:MAG TPA: hypothetical protein VGA86_09915, partial [Desulfatiglandales bacterium]
DFSEDELYLLDSTEGAALSVTPLMFRDSCINHPDVEAGHFYLFDKAMPPPIKNGPTLAIEMDPPRSCMFLSLGGDKTGLETLLC